MKNSCRTFSPAVVAGALALLAAMPQAASAQVVGNGFVRSGVVGSGVVGRPGVSMPVPSQSPQAFAPMRGGTVYGRPGGAFAPPAVYNQPNFNQPGFNQPGFNQPVYNPPAFNGMNYGAPVYNNVPAYNPGYNNPGYNSTPSYNGGSFYRSERSFGPTVSVPNPYEGRPNVGDNRLRGGRFGGAVNGGYNQSGSQFGASQTYSNTEGTRSLRPVGPAYGYSSGGASGGRSFRITTSRGSQVVPPTVYHNNYIYNNYSNSGNSLTTIVGAPPLLGGYYYAGYCDTYAQVGTYPSVYSAYDGLPPYIYNPAANIITVGQPTIVQYVTPYLPFDTPNYTVTYNQNNYYVANEGRVSQIEGGGAPAREAIKNAYPADSYQAAFADIARAWTEGDIAPLRKHIRDADTRVSVFLNKKYSYSIASGDFTQITRDALDRLHTVSFDLTRLRKSKSGDVTAYGTHVYRTGDSAGGSDTATVPFDQNGADPNAAGDTGQQASPYDKSGDPAVGTEKTVYVSYTLRHRDGQWYIIEVGSSDRDLVPTE